MCAKADDDSLGHGVIVTVSEYAVGQHVPSGGRGRRHGRAEVHGSAA